MENDPFPLFTNLTQGQLGEFFGVSSHKIGRWLIEVGLRTSEMEPSNKAIEGRFMQMHSTDYGPRFPVWDKEKTVKALELAGHKRSQAADEPKESMVTPTGPFTARRSSADGGGFEIVGGDSTVAVWCRGERFAGRLALLLTVADRHGKLE